VPATLYILGDGDRIRERIEAALFSRDLARLSEISTALKCGIAMVVDRMVERMLAEVVMAGGDDVLFTVAAENFDIAVVEEIAREFASYTGCTISFGVGASPDEAYLHLRRAKASGGGAISAGLRK
jgi:CRISPR/Cas system-associated protein Cas10 (large subunit of type III CRISPR-Cas system)